VHWCVLSGSGEREREARASASDFLSAAQRSQIKIMSFRDGFFPEQGAAIKSWFEALRERVDRDLILTHRRGDAHQDHRQVCRLTWNTFRDHFILEYEIPKWDGDMGQATSTPMVSFFIFSAPLLVIRGCLPGIRSGQRKRRGRSNSSSTRQTASVLPIRPSPLTKGQPPSPSGSFSPRRREKS
jgi:GlcNAc-PI de-N-acetylase